MNNLVKINNKNVERIIYSNQPVITFKDIDNLHERPNGTAKRNFYNNQKHFIENVDFYHITVENTKSTKFVHWNIPPKGQYLFTESGYLMLVKSFTDDLAWQVQRQLVNCYFRFKEEKALEEYKIENKTYKGQPVMVVRDIEFLTGVSRDSINWIIKRDGLGLLLQGRILNDFRRENDFSVTATRRINILFEEDVYKLIREYKINNINTVYEYFGCKAISEVKNQEDVLKMVKMDSLFNLYKTMRLFVVDKKMREDITFIISEKMVELGFLERSCKDLDINTKEGWNLMCRYSDFKRSIIK